MKYLNTVYPIPHVKLGLWTKINL